MLFKILAALALGSLFYTGLVWYVFKGTGVLPPKGKG